MPILNVKISSKKSANLTRFTDSIGSRKILRHFYQGHPDVCLGKQPNAMCGCDTAQFLTRG